MPIHKYFDDICKGRGISAAELARRAGIDESALSRIKTGKNKNPSFETFRKLAQFLEVTIDYLGGEKGHEKPTPAILAAESLEIFCRSNRIGIESRRELEDMTGDPSAPAKVQDWRNHLDRLSFREQRKNKTES